MADIPFDQRDGWIWYNGELVPWKDAKVHVLSAWQACRTGLDF